MRRRKHAIRSNHIGARVTVNNVQYQTNDELDDSMNIMSEQQLVEDEEESSHIHSGEDDEILQECSSAAFISLEAEHLQTDNIPVTNSSQAFHTGIKQIITTWA